MLGGYMSPVGDAYSKPDLASAHHRCAPGTLIPESLKPCARGVAAHGRPPSAHLADWNGHSTAQPRDAAVALQRLLSSRLAPHVV